jgi:3-oxoacyl-[acyl-carrier protein] reductase
MSEQRRVCIISGGSRGLGEALAQDLLEQGNIVATFSRAASSFTSECKEKYGEDAFVFRELDGGVFADVNRFVIDICRRFGRVDVLINNAALVLEGLLTLTPPAEVDKALNANLRGPVWLTQACAKAMLRQRHGNIINISSINGIRGNKGVAVYSATKAALDGFTRSLARELGPKGIRVNSICPGYLDTGMTRNMSEEKREQVIKRTPLGRLGTVNDIIGVVRFLLANDSSFVTGQVIVADGGLTC